ncbi:MAG: hypothetical protein LN568_05545 [Rickettsia endosymbiont of Pseudomimeciton antennatum]|nr:hypothetical protein [Rickettsia endosymbiont of Pseudomimeciton antennatum]
MKDNPQPTNVLEENSNEVTEQIEESQDLAILDLSMLEKKKKYHHDRKELAEKTLKKIAEHYKLEKRKAKLISRGLQLTAKNNNVANRQFFKEMSTNFRYIHGLSPRQAILNRLQPLTNLRDQE